MKKLSFKKKERVKGRSKVGKIFSSGKSITVLPFRLIWTQKPLTAKLPVQILVSVPKKLFPKAVLRNRLKRRVREAYRKNKDFFYEFLLKRNLQLMVGIIYIEKEAVGYREIEQKMILSLQKIIEKLK